MSLHADKVVAAAETYMGLIWRWVIPGGGGSKEMALRASDLFHKMTWNCITRVFLDHCYGKVSTGYEALTADFYKRKRYHCCKQRRQIAEAKKHALMAEARIYTTNSQNGCKSTWKTSIRYVLSRN
jgi:3-hydroxyacyl-CoA dehydrogenase